MPGLCLAGPTGLLGLINLYEIHPSMIQAATQEMYCILLVINAGENESYI